MGVLAGSFGKESLLSTLGPEEGLSAPRLRAWKAVKKQIGFIMLPMIFRLIRLKTGLQQAPAAGGPPTGKLFFYSVPIKTFEFRRQS